MGILGLGFDEVWGFRVFGFSGFRVLGFGVGVGVWSLDFGV